MIIELNTILYNFNFTKINEEKIVKDIFYLFLTITIFTIQILLMYFFSIEINKTIKNLLLVECYLSSLSIILNIIALKITFEQYYDNTKECKNYDTKIKIISKINNLILLSSNTIGIILFVFYEKHKFYNPLIFYVMYYFISGLCVYVYHIGYYFNKTIIEQKENDTVYIELNT